MFKKRPLTEKEKLSKHNRRMVISQAYKDGYWLGIEKGKQMQREEQIRFTNDAYEREIKALRQTIELLKRELIRVGREKNVLKNNSIK